MRLNGFRYIAKFPPDLKKFVLVAAPHTSNFDFPLAKAAFYLMGMRVRFLAKDSLFKGFFGRLFYLWGGIPVDRSNKLNMVEQLKEQFDKVDELALVISPEATRKSVEHWKSGFYHIAKGAGVPIVCGYIDYDKKEAGVGPIIYDLSDIHKVEETMKEFYRNIGAKVPGNYNPDFTVGS